MQDVGATVLNPSGTLNPGTIAVNGQREFANFFSVNGADVEEDVNAGTAIIPNLDAIDEFRIITSNFDAEYGEFSGGQINVITKSGSNAFHGNAFDFLRNTDLDARNYFSPTRGVFRQNQFGGTIGGPDSPGQDLLLHRLPGNPADAGHRYGHDQRAFERGPQRATSATPDSQLAGTVGGPYFANLLTQKLGYGVTTGESYYVPGCTSIDSMRVSQRGDSSECVVSPGAAHAAVHPGSEYRQRLCDFILQPDGPR